MNNPNYCLQVGEAIVPLSEYDIGIVVSAQERKKDYFCYEVKWLRQNFTQWYNQSIINDTFSKGLWNVCEMKYDEGK